MDKYNDILSLAYVMGGFIVLLTCLVAWLSTRYVELKDQVRRELYLRDIIEGRQEEMADQIIELEAKLDLQNRGGLLPEDYESLGETLH